MRSSSDVRFITVVALVVAMLGAVVSFSSMSYALNDDKVDETVDAKWDVHFSNLSEPVVTGTAGVANVPLFTSTYIGNFAVNLNAPGDSVSYTFDVKNDGNIDAILGAYSIKPPVCTVLSTTKNNLNSCENIEYYLTYTDSGEIIAQGDQLKKNSTVNLTLKINYLNTPTIYSVVPLQVTGLDVTLIYDQN